MIWKGRREGAPKEGKEPLPTYSCFKRERGGKKGQSSRKKNKKKEEV